MQNESEIIAGHGVFGGGGGGQSEKSGRFVETAALKTECSQPLQGPDMIGVDLQDSPEMPLGFFQPALTVQQLPGLVMLLGRQPSLRTVGGVRRHDVDRLIHRKRAEGGMDTIAALALRKQPKFAFGEYRPTC
jgi:hypothetical protein